MNDDLQKFLTVEIMKSCVQNGDNAMKTSQNNVRVALLMFASSVVMFLCCLCFMAYMWFFSMDIETIEEEIEEVTITQQVENVGDNSTNDINNINIEGGL